MKNLNFQNNFTKKKSNHTATEIDINLNTLDKYSKSDLIDYIKQYEKIAISQKGNLDDYQTMNEELQRQVTTITEELSFQSENTDILKEDAKNCFVSYQRLNDQAESNMYLENFASKLAKKCFKMEDGKEQGNEYQEIVDLFQQISKKMNNLKEIIDDKTAAITKDENTSESLDNVQQYLEEIYKVLGESNETINDDLPIINDNVLLLIQRFDLLCDELSTIYTNTPTQELNKTKGFSFITHAKYDEINSQPAILKLQLKESNTKVSRTEALYHAAQDEVKANSEIISMYQKQIGEFQTNFEAKLKQNNDNSELQEMIVELTNQNEAIKNEISEKTILIEGHMITQDNLLAQIKKLEQNSSNKSVSQESLLKQEILRREQIEKDYAKLDSKYNEVNMYLRQEVERGTTLVQQNEKTDAKYKKVKTALKELTEKYKELDESNKKVELSEIAIKEQDDLRKDLEDRKKQDEALREQLSGVEQQLTEEVSKNDQHNIVLLKKDNDFQELKKILEEKLEFIESLQATNIQEIEKVKAQKDKRKNGLKEIKKLKAKVEELTDEIANQSSWFGSKTDREKNVDMDSSINDMSIMVDPSQVGVLEKQITDLQVIYKTLVLLLPLKDPEANMKVVEIERKMNSVINCIWEHIADA